MGRLYWIVAGILAAIAAHSAFILAAPSLSFGRDLATVTASSGSNRFFFPDPAQQLRLFPGYPPESVIGLCAFELSQGNVKLSANMPEGYWTVNVYSRRGNVIYAVNDSQAGTTSFTLDISLTPSLFDTLMAATQAEKPDIDTGWTVESPDPQGLAVLIYPLSEGGLRASIMRRMETSSCNQTAG